MCFLLLIFAVGASFLVKDSRGYPFFYALNRKSVPLTPDGTLNDFYDFLDKNVKITDYKIKLKKMINCRYEDT